MTFSDQDMRDAFDKEREQTLRAEVVESFQGRQRWLVLVVWIAAPVIFGVSVWAAVRFFQTDHADVRNLVLFATIFMWASVGVGLLKSWYYSRLDRNAILRELKRLELRLGQAE